MDKIEWGALIDAENGGKPLSWLGADDKFMCRWEYAGGEYGPYHVGVTYGWGAGFQIRLPADHPYYSESNISDWEAMAAAECDLAVDDSDYVRVKRIPRGNIERLLINNDYDIEVILSSLGLIREETLLEQFEREHPEPMSERTRRHVREALEWMESRNA